MFPLQILSKCLHSLSMPMSKLPLLSSKGSPYWAIICATSSCFWNSLLIWCANGVASSLIKNWNAGRLRRQEDANTTQWVIHKQLPFRRQKMTHYTPSVVCNSSAIIPSSHTPRVPFLTKTKLKSLKVAHACFSPTPFSPTWSAPESTLDES